MCTRLLLIFKIIYNLYIFSIPTHILRIWVVVFYLRISTSWVKSSCLRGTQLLPMSWVLQHAFPFDCAKVCGSFQFAARRKSRKLFSLSLSLSHTLLLSLSLPLSDEVWKMQTNFLARSRKFSSSYFFFVFAVPITFWEGSKYSAKGSGTQCRAGRAEGVASCKFVMRKSYKTWVFRVLTKSNWGGNP